MSLLALNKIAKEAGVSRWTVSRVLRGEVDYVRPHAAERAHRIREVAERLGYRPNAAAQAVGRGRFDTIALLSNADDPAYLSGPLLSGLQTAAAEARQHLVLERLAAVDLSEPDVVPQVLRRSSCDVILFHAIGPLPERLEQLVQQFRLPVLWINAKRETDSISLADEAAGRDATNALIRLGHRKIAFVCSQSTPKSHYSVDDRRDGYTDAMKAAGLEARVCEISFDVMFNHEPSPAKAIAPLLRGADRVTAVVAMAKSVAGFVYVEALRRRLSVPRDLSIITFGATVTNGVGIRFARGVLPEAEVGRRAIQLAAEKVANPDRALPALVLPIAFEGNETLAPPRSRG